MLLADMSHSLLALRTSGWLGLLSIVVQWKNFGSLDQDGAESLIASEFGKGWAREIQAKVLGSKDMNI